MNSGYCDACECDPCDCGWGSYIKMWAPVLVCCALLSCSTEVGLLGYKDKNQDSSLAVDTDSSLPPLPDSGDPPANSGITGYTHYKLRQVACPPCVGETQEIAITFSAKFHQPSTDGHTEWLPAVGTCTENLYTVTPSTVPTSVGSMLTVTSPQHTFTAPAVSTGNYLTNQIYEAQYQRDATYTVQTDAGSYNFVSSHGFDFIEPYTLLWIDPSYAYDAVISKSTVGTTFTWSPTSTDSIFVVTVAVYSWDGSQFLGRVDCAGDDNGFMNIPGSYFSSYPAGSLTAVHLTRHKVSLSETDINNSFVESHMEWEVIGTGQIGN